MAKNDSKYLSGNEPVYENAIHISGGSKTLGPAASSSSYDKTKIPRGAPKRYSSRGVIRMFPNPKMSFHDQPVDGPGEAVETEAQRQLKTLLSKQLQPSLDIARVEKKSFTEPAIHCSLGEEVKGARLLEQYKMIVDKHGRLEELRELGLTEDEIILKLTEDGESLEDYNLGPSTKKRKYGVDPTAHKQRLDHIKEKIRLRMEAREEPIKYSGVRQMNRHELEIERSLLKGTEGSHDLNHLVVAGHSREHFAYPKLVLANMEGSSEDELSEEEHDDKAMINSSTEQSPHIEALPLQVICRHKLSDEEIKSLPRFANHKPGQPSNVLYLKNLHPKVTEDDLHAIFGHHQSQASEKLKIRLLTGRMKGQAFVEFPSIELATSAMELVHGYLIREKPVIISYGNRGKT